jgi:sulfur relay (sulfurtransferase) DsrF/TusC family protein
MNEQICDIGKLNVALLQGHISNLSFYNTEQLYIQKSILREKKLLLQELVEV